MRYQFSLFFFVCCMLALHTAAQKQGQDRIDSLIAAVPGAANDTVRERIFNRVATYYTDVNADTAFMYAARGMELACKMKWEKGISTFHTVYGSAFSTLGLSDSAVKHYQQALDISMRLKDTTNMAVSYNNLGGVFNSKSDFVSAAKYFTSTLQLGLAVKNTYTIGLACENLALVYFNQGDFARSLEFGRQSYAAYQRGGHQEMKQGALQAMANAFRRAKLFDSAYHYYQQALAFCRQNGNKIEEAGLLNALAQYYADQENFDKALEASLEAKKIWDATSPMYEDAINNTGLTGYYYLQLAKRNPKTSRQMELNAGGSSKQLLHLAQTYLENAVTQNRAAGNKIAASEFQNNLAEVYALSGDFKNAYLNFQSYQQVKDSIYSQENKNKIATAIAKLEVDKKNDEIAISKLTIASQRRNQVFFISGLLLLGVIGGLLFWQSRTRKKTNTTLMVLNNQLDDANKVKAKFFAILSHDLRGPVANLISFLHLQKEEPGLLSQAQVAANQQKITVSAESLLETMEAMLLWSKGQMENFKPEIRPIPVRQLFDYLEKFFAGTAQVQFIFNDPGDIEVNTDENYLQTIMQNLTANAVKALKNTPAAQIEWKAVKEGDKTYLSITDNGPGIQEEQSKALYDDTVAANTKYGLGLHLVRDLAKAIHCKIALQTRPGAGTTFTLIA